MMDKLEILEIIEQMVKPLNPPVEAFENSARRSPFKILISVLLSSRTKDAVTHRAVEKLFAVADSPQKIEKLDEKHIEELIFPVGFYRQKAKNIKKIAGFLSKSLTGNPPGSFDELTSLPGVGRKTANLVLALAFGIPSIAVDIHVFRISQRLGWAKGEKPEEIEEQLKTAFPSDSWNRINHILVGFGQTLCKPVNPLCHRCEITGSCLYYKKVIASPGARGPANKEA
jgi:endonuclease III